MLLDRRRFVAGLSAVLTRAQLEALYQASVETLTDTDTGSTAFLPG